MNELHHLDWIEIVDHLSRFGTSELTRSRLRDIQPLPTKEDCIKNFSEIYEAMTVIKNGVRPHMESLDLFSPWYMRICRNAVLKTLEIKDVRHFCSEALALKEILSRYSSHYLDSINNQIMNAKEPLSAIDQLLTPAGDVRVDASEKLHNLNLEKASLARQVESALDQLVKNYKIEHILQDRFVTTREGRWVIPIKSGMQHAFSGIVHASSQSKQTVFMEPQEVLPINNRLRQIETEIEDEIERLMIELSTYLSSLRYDFDSTKKILFEFDTRLAQAQLSVQINAHPCEFSEEKLIIRNIRHPLLVIAGKEVVENTVELNLEKRVLLLSGPNAGGKTVLLKSMGLAAQMARCGLPICADTDSQLPFFKNMIVSIGDAQNVNSDLSTFAAHLKKLAQATHMSGPLSLILIDEICGSTDPEEGAALARAFINCFLNNGTFAVITSHLGALKKDWPANSPLINGSLEFDNHSGPTYKLILGLAGHSLAIQTAKKIGINKQIIDEAMSYMSPDLQKYQSALTDVEQMRADLIHLQKKLSIERQEAEKQKNHYMQLIVKFDQEREKLLDKELRKATKKIDELIQVGQVKDVFKKYEDLEKIKYDLPQIIKQTDVENQKQKNVMTTASEFFIHYPPGSNVHISSLGRDGIIQGKPNAKGEVPVLSQSMRLYVSWQDLKPALKNHNPTQSVLKKSGHFGFSPADSDRSVDLRGLNSEEAISQLEIQLDTASLRDEDRVKVIHGHGTEALKKTIRSYLSRSVYVKKWMAGSKETGGDGITWIELK